MSDSAFTLEIPGLSQAFPVVEFTGREALSQAFRFDIDAVAALDIDVSAWLGATAVLRITSGDRARAITGIIERVKKGTVLAAEQVTQRSTRPPPASARPSQNQQGVSGASRHRDRPSGARGARHRVAHRRHPRRHPSRNLHSAGRVGPRVRPAPAGRGGRRVSVRGGRRSHR